MIGIVIVAHGGLASEYLSAVEHVVGGQLGMRAISTAAEVDRVSKSQEIAMAVQDVDQGQGVVVVVDMFGGTPANLSLPACDRADRKILYGANLPMLLKLAKTRNLPVEVSVQKALTAGRKYIDCIGGV